MAECFSEGNSKKGKPAILPAHSLAFFYPQFLARQSEKVKRTAIVVLWVDRSGKANLHFVNVSICQNALQKIMPSFETAGARGFLKRPLGQSEGINLD